MKESGKIKTCYPYFKRNNKLAELIGVVLGDGHIQKFPRTERLIISANSNNEGFIDRYRNIVRDVFIKEPTCSKVKSKNCVRISIYEKFISKRLSIATGNRSGNDEGIPYWAKKNKSLLIDCLRGLYEAEGSFSIHKPTCTYKAAFSNKNKRLLTDVHNALQALGFSPLYERYRIMISRREEFFKLKMLINFRKY